MFDKNTKTELRKAGFYEFQDSLENLIAFQAKKTNKVVKTIHELIKKRGIPNTTLNKAIINNQEFLIVTKAISSEVKTQVAIAVDEYGKDMRFQIAFSHYDEKAHRKQSLTSTIIMIIGGIFIWTGVGALGLIVGIIMLNGAKNQFSEVYISERDNFYKTILEIISDSCDKTGIIFDAKSNAL